MEGLKPSGSAASSSARPLRSGFWISQLPASSTIWGLVDAVSTWASTGSG